MAIAKVFVLKEKQVDEVLNMIPTVNKAMVKIGRWKPTKHDGGMTPGGTPIYVCGHCGGSAHLNGCEYPKRKIICDKCGRINIYPWEDAHERGSSFWEEDENAAD